MAMVRIEIEADSDELQKFAEKMVFGELALELLKDLTEEVKIEDVEEVEEKEEKEDVEPSPKEEKSTTKVNIVETEEHPEPTKDEVELTAEMIISALPPKRGRPPMNALKEYLRSVIVTGSVEVPTSYISDKYIDQLTRWHIAKVIKSDGNGYVLVPNDKVKAIIETNILKVKG